MIPFCPCGRVGRVGRAKVMTNNMCRDCLAEEFGWVAVLRFEQAMLEGMRELLAPKPEDQSSEEVSHSK